MNRLALAALLLLPLPAYAEGWSATTTNGVTVHSYTPARRPEPVIVPAPSQTIIVNQPPQNYLPSYGSVYPLPQRFYRHRR